MVKNLTEQEIYLFITSDFKSAWNSLASNPVSSIGRGNFMFARQAMNLLEFACRLCDRDPAHQAINDLSKELLRMESRYFTELPARCVASDFMLPHNGNTTGNLLLWTLFDLIRHGLAHQYQQMIVTLSDGKHFSVTLTGASYGRQLNIAAQSRPTNHLAFTVDSDGDLEMKVYPEILFMDIDNAIVSMGLLNRGLVFDHLTRPKQTRQSFYQFDSSSLKNSFLTGGHTQY